MCTLNVIAKNCDIEMSEAGHVTILGFVDAAAAARRTDNTTGVGRPVHALHPVDVSGIESQEELRTAGKALHGKPITSRASFTRREKPFMVSPSLSGQASLDGKSTSW